MCSLVILVILSTSLLYSVIGIDSCELSAKGSSNFPANFSFGVSTSAYQIEGAWNADGKGPSIWDEYTHKKPQSIYDWSNGDVAADSYRRFDLDLQALKALKVNHYRFSISWPRIYPNGDISSRNQKGIDYYNKVIDKLLANGIEPMVTMFHYDLPLEIQKFGGFVNSVFITQFVTYAIELFENFGDRVKTWMTFNEPLIFCKSSYADARYPPEIDAHGVGDYICIDNTLKAHAAAYRAYRSRFYDKQRGKIGMAIDSYFFFPKSENDIDAARRALEFNLGFLANPIFHKSGGYPQVMVEDIERNSLKEGRLTSRLPTMDKKWKDMIKGSADFFALNYYSARLVERGNQTNGLNPSFERDMDCDESIDQKWIRGGTDWSYCVPEGLEEMLKFVRDQYDNVEVVISENGWSDAGDLKDDARIRFLKSHLQAVLNAINDGCNVTGFTYWSLIDNFEWRMGYTTKFGLFSVDMFSPKRKRIPRDSASYYREVITTKTIPKDVQKEL